MTRRPFSKPVRAQEERYSPPRADQGFWQNEKPGLRDYRSSKRYGQRCKHMYGLIRAYADVDTACSSKEQWMDYRRAFP